MFMYIVCVVSAALLLLPRGPHRYSRGARYMYICMFMYIVYIGLTPQSVAAAYAAEVISRTVCRLAAAAAGPAIGIPEVRDTCVFVCLCI